MFQKEKKQHVAAMKKEKVGPVTLQRPNSSPRFTKFDHGNCWTRQNITEPVSAQVSPCAKRVPGPIQAVELSEA